MQMSKASVLVAAIALMVLAGCGKLDENIRTITVSGNDGTRVDEKRIPELELQAAAGSEEAAHLLSRHYSFYARDYERGLYWSGIAAENGGAQAMRNYAVSLGARGDPFSRERSKFWYRKVIESGVEPHASSAKEALRQMNSTWMPGTSPDMTCEF